MFEWLRRALTLPKAKNSLSDVVGNDLARLLKQMARHQLDAAITQAFSEPIKTTVALREAVIQAIRQTVGGQLPEPFPNLIRSFVEDAFRKFEGDLERTRYELLTRLRRELKLD